MGSIFQTNSDTEVVLHLYAKSTAGTAADAIVDAVSQVRGAFSLVLLTSDSLIAVRDPRGFRPLALGRLGPGGLSVCTQIILYVLAWSGWSAVSRLRKGRSWR